MKRSGKLWERISSRANVQLAFERALKKIDNDKIRKDVLDHWYVYQNKIHSMLVNRDYKFGPMVEFVIQEKKKRVIHHPKHYYPDCLLYYCLMNVLEEKFVRKMTSDTYSSIKGRGVQYALHRAEPAVRKNKDYYFLYIDCRKYYASVDHDKLKVIIRSVFKCQYTLEMLDKIIDAHSPGLAIGVYPSQYLANLFLSKVDHFVKEELRVPYYYRYMDDMMFVLPSKEECHRINEIINQKIQELALQVKNNIRIAPIDYGIGFLGYKMYTSHTRISKSIKEGMKRKDRALRKINADDWLYKQQMSSYFGWCIHANCINLMRKVFADKYKLFEKDIEKHRFKKKMEVNRFRDSRDLYFGMEKDGRIVVDTLIDKQIVIFQYKKFTSQYGERITFQFAHRRKGASSEDYTDEEKLYTITGSRSMSDRISDEKNKFPFDCKVVKVQSKSSAKKYLTIIPIPEEER